MPAAIRRLFTKAPPLFRAVMVSFTVFILILTATIWSVMQTTPEYVARVTLIPSHSEISALLSRDAEDSRLLVSASAKRRARIHDADTVVSLFHSRHMHRIIAADPGILELHGIADGIALDWTALRHQFQVRRLRKRNVVEVAYRHADPDLARMILDRAIHLFEVDLRTRYGMKVSEQMALLDYRLQKASGREAQSLALLYAEEQAEKIWFKGSRAFSVHPVDRAVVDPRPTSASIPVRAGLGMVYALSVAILVALLMNMRSSNAKLMPRSRGIAPNYNRARIVRWTSLLVLLMLCGTLAIDALTGAAILFAGVDLKLSMLVKILMIMLMYWGLFIIHPRRAAALGVMVAVLLAGPTRSFIEGSGLGWLVADYANAMKLVLPLLTIAWLIAVDSWHPGTAKIWIPRVFAINFGVFFVSILIGVTGGGFATYDQADEAGVGTSGLFYAGNEVSGVYVLMTTVALHVIWSQARWLFLPMVLFSILMAVVISTKVALVAAVLLPALVPIANERHRLFHITLLKIGLVACVATTLVAFFIVFWEWILQLGLVTRFEYVFRTRGLWGFVFSGRDLFVIDFLNAVEHRYDIFNLLFGAGISGLQGHVAVTSAEVDIVDSFAFFGTLGALVAITIHCGFLFATLRTVRRAESEFAPAAFLTMSLLIPVSIFSGHIWFSGMLGALLGMLVFASTLGGRNCHDDETKWFKLNSGRSQRR